MNVNDVFIGGRRVESWNGNTGTFTRWDGAGRVIESRPLTAEELAALTPAPDPRAELLDRIGQATMLDEIREIVADAISGGTL